jgi:hypothetical protein
MPKKVEIEVYLFDELDDDAKEVARDWWRAGAFDYEWYDATYDDAKDIGLKITSFDIDRHIEGELLASVESIARKIIQNHGPTCGTTHLATDYYARKALGNPYSQEEFKHDLLEEYLSMLRKEAMQADCDTEEKYESLNK